MPAIGNITVNDGAATPVAHTFAPVSVIGTKAFYADRAGGIPVGYNTMEITVREPVSKDPSSRQFLCVLRTVTPVLEVTSPSTATGIQPAPTVGYKLSAKTEYLMHERSSLQNRKDLNALHKNALANAVWTTAIESLEAVY